MSSTSPIANYRFNSVMNQLPGMGNRKPLYPDLSLPPKPFPNMSFPMKPQTLDTSPSPPSMDPAQDRASRFYDELQKIRGESGPGITAYKQALSEMPTQEQYAPNWMTRIGAALGGLSAGIRDPSKGVETAMNINRSGYRNAMEQYSNKLGGLKEQADLEQKELDTKADMVNKAMGYGLDYDKFRETQRTHESEARARDINAQSASTQATASMIRAMNSARDDYEYIPVQGGFMAVNKHDKGDRSIVPGTSIQEAQLGVARQNAATASRQADTSAENAETNRYNAITNRGVGAARINDLNSQVENRQNTPIQPGAQESARKLAIQELSMDPLYSKYLKPDLDLTTLPPEELDTLREVIQRKVMEIEHRRR